MEMDRLAWLRNCLAQLRQGDEMARAAAAQELGKLRDQHATDALVAAMQEDPSPLVRRYAAAALGDLGDVYAVDSLAKALGDPVTSWHAAQALRRIGTPSALSALQQVRTAS